MDPVPPGASGGPAGVGSCGMLIDPELVLAALARTPLFARLEPEELERLLNAIDLYRVPAGRALFAEGDEGDALYVVLSGRISIRRALQQGGVHELAELGEDSVFGEMALLDGAPRMATAVASRDSIVAGLSRATFDRLSEERDPLVQPLLRAVAGVLCERLREVTHVLQGLVDFDQEPSAPESLLAALAQGLTWN